MTARWAARVVAGAVLAALAFCPVAAQARERIAVLVLPAGEAEAALADNLTEIVIARLAQDPDRELIGTPELRARVARSGGDPLPRNCADKTTCLGRIGVMTGARRLLAGNVRSEGARVVVTLTLTDLASGKAEGSLFRAVDGGEDAVIAAVQEGLEDLLRPAPAPGQVRVSSLPDGARVTLDERYQGTTPISLGPVEPGAHRLRIEMDGRFPFERVVEVAAAQRVLVTVDRDELKPRRTWAPYVVYGAGAVAVAALAAAALYGTAARADASGPTRLDAQQDLERRKQYATTSNVLFAAGGVLAGVSLFTFVWLRHDVADP